MTDEGAGNLSAAVTKTYDLLLWLINHVGKFPRSHRFVLGDRIESRVLTVLESFVLAVYAREKKAHYSRPTEMCRCCTAGAYGVARYIDSFSVTLRIWIPCTREEPPRMAQATWTASVISSMLDPFQDRPVCRHRCSRDIGLRGQQRER